MASIFQSSMTMSLPSTIISSSNYDYVFPMASFKISSRNPSLYKYQPGVQHYQSCHTNQLNQKRAITVACATVGEEVDTESTTNVVFPRLINLPGCSSPLQLIGTGFRDKSVAIIKVTVYAVGMYVDPSISTFLSTWKGRNTDDLKEDATFLKAAAEAPVNKGIRIVLVRDVDGATFWEAMNEALSPRIKALNGAADQEALKTFGSVFLGRSLKQGTSIYLTWVQPSRLEVAISGDSSVPEASDASINSAALLLSLFDVYLGEDPVSPSAKSSVLLGLQAFL